MLHSQIVTTSNLAALRNAISRPKEIILPYEKSRVPYETCLCLDMKATFGDVEVLARYFDLAREVASHLGDWCADQIWAMALGDEEPHKLERKAEKAFRHGQRGRPIASLDVDLGKLKEAKELTAQRAVVAPSLDGNSISAKAKVFLTYMDEKFAKEKPGKCIIFVNTRWTARLLKELLVRMCASYVRPDLLIGTGAGDAGDTKISFKKQLSALNSFRKGETNCLIATSIAEEGLDIPDCNMVVRFDLYTTLIQYIQSRGRARDVNSTYVHMIESGNKAHLQLIQEVKRGENKMRNFCEALPADRLLQGDGKEYDFDAVVIKERGQRKFTDPLTKATLTYTSSIVVLDNFVSRLPHDGESAPRVAYYVFRQDGNFLCEITLPNTSPIHFAVGRAHSTKAIARRSAAFEACILLRQKEFLDGNFISIYRKILPQMRNARLALTGNKSNVYSRKLKPKEWEICRGSLPKKLYITVLELERPDKLGLPCQPLAIMTRTRLPKFPAFRLGLQINESSDLLCIAKDQSVEVDGPMLEMLDTFTQRIFLDVFNKKYEANTAAMSYWLGPVIKCWTSAIEGDIVDWPTLEKVFQSPDGLKWSVDAPVEQYINRFLVDRWDGGRRFFSVALEPGLQACDPVPECVARNRSIKSILDYSVGWLRLSREKVDWNKDQPVVRAHRFLHRINWLEDFTEEQYKINTKVWLCLQPLLISAVSVSIREWEN